MSHALENSIEKSIDISAPLRSVFNQWTKFEDYPKFMEGVREVKRFDGNRLHWRAVFEGREMEWDSEIIEQTPDTRITWKSFNSPVEDGMVSFTTIYEGTRVTLQMRVDPARLVRPADGGDPRTALVRRVEGSLQRFKEFIEGRGLETLGSRGEMPGGEVIHERASDETDIFRPGQKLD
ncbi:MAG: SRPBCC family protein [Planctomycetaceae bacterium]|nr:SRPBCC family protein [Planctomycetaceae bacterium]